MLYPRILVVSNNSFSKTGSNGRTLGVFFSGWPKDRLAQFCISTDTPDFDVCDNYYMITDKSALDGFKHFQKARRCNINDNFSSKGNFQLAQKKVYKTPLKALIRNMVWGNERWYSDEFEEWLDAFSPEVVLLMNSDSAFMLKIAVNVSKKRQIPLLMYNTEGYYFFKKPYMNAGRFDKLFFDLYQCIYRKQYRKTMQHVRLTIYSNSKLQEDYVREFGGENLIIYTGSTMAFEPGEFDKHNPMFSYLGNLAYNRLDALVEVAEVLQSINNNYKLNVYGKVSPEKSEQLRNHPGINLCGFIPYDQVVSTIKKSDILFHAETQDEKWKEALKYGFSTKIADSVSSGKCFVIYSSRDIAGADYIIKTGAGWFADDKESLKTIIQNIIVNELERNRVQLIAHLTARRNHDAVENRKAFLDAINKSLSK